MAKVFLYGSKAVFFVLLFFSLFYEYIKVDEDIVLTLKFANSLEIASSPSLHHDAQKFSGQILNEMLLLRGNLYFQIVLIFAIVFLEVANYYLQKKSKTK